MNFPCFLWTLLSLSSICSAYILIDPILLIDATHKLSSFLLSAEIQNVKDIADAVFSQENIDAVTLIASNTADVARNTVLNAQSGIDALANSVPTAKVASSLQAFLESNQDLTQSSSEYASSVATSVGSKIAQSFDEYLVNNPSLSKSTSAYTSDLISDIYGNTITPKVNDILATLDKSPLAMGTREAIKDSPRALEKITDFYNSKIAQILDLKTKVSGISGVSDFTEFTTTSKAIIGDKINENFDKVISTYPELKQSTSEFAVSTLNNAVVPKLKETGDFLYKSPLSQSTRELAVRSTSDVVSAFSTDVSTRLSPYTSVLGDVGNRLFSRATSPITDLLTDLGSAVRSAAVETKKASAELLLSQKDTFGSVPVNLDVSDIIAEQKNSLKATSSVVFENILPVTQNVLTAVGGANARFLSQLGDAGNILGGNLFNLGAAASDITAKLLSSAASSSIAAVQSIEGTAAEAPGKISELVTVAPSVLRDLSQSVVGSTVAITERTADTVTNTVESSLSAVSGWKFFSDENHWKNGYWEQKLVALGDLKQSDFSPESLEKLNQQILSTLDAAGKRFTAQYESSKAQSFSTLGLKDSFNFAEVKNFDVYNRNFQEFQSNLKAASETAVSVTDNIVKTGGKAAVELNKLKDSSVQLLTEELKSNDFI